MLNKMVRIEMKASYHSFAFLMAVGLLFCSAQSVVHANPIVLAYAPYAPAPSILTKAPPPSHSACPPTTTPTKSPPPPSSPPPPLPSSPPPPAPKYAPPPPPFTPPPPPFMIGAAVEGVIYCASCKLKGYDPSLNASPLPGIPTKLLCNSTKKGLTINGNATTDSKGYYLIQAQNKNPNQMKSCRLVVRMPIWCNKPISPRGSKAGFPLHFEKVYKFGTSQVALFTTAFMEFGPSSKELCPKRP